MEDRIEGKIVAINNKGIIVLNCGEREDVREGMTFAIFTIGEKIIDPETGKDLGNFEDVKAKVKVIHVQERICSARELSRSYKADLTLTMITEGGAESEALEVEIGDHAREYTDITTLLNPMQYF